MSKYEIDTSLNKYIKKTPYDFQVYEKSIYNPEKEGKYLFLRLRKINISTLEAIRTFAKVNNIPLKEIGFAGLKDKYAYTEQFLSLPKDYENKIKYFSFIIFNQKVKSFEKVFQKEKIFEIYKRNFKQKIFSVEKIGYLKNKLSLGDLKGNEFIITLHNIHSKLFKQIRKNIQIVKKFGVANYFGEQRFGSLKDRSNFIILEATKGNFEKAIYIYFLEGRDPSLKKYWGDWESLYKKLKDSLEDFERDVILGLKRGLSFKKAFQIFPKNIKLMFYFAFQSFIWNKILSIYIKRKYPSGKVKFITNLPLYFYYEVYDYEYLKNLEIPYLGYKYEVKDPLLKDIFKSILKNFNIDESLYDMNFFNLKIFTDGKRKAIVDKDVLNINILKKEKGKLKLKFFLPTGSYATILLRKITFLR